MYLILARPWFVRKGETLKFYRHVLATVLFLSSCQSPIARKTPAIITETSTPVLDDAPSMYEIPQWLRNPGTNVLMYTQSMRNPKNLDSIPQSIVVLLDPQSGSKFSLKLEDGRQLYQWIDNQTIGFSPLPNLECRSGAAYSYILNLSSGSLVANDFGSHFCLPDQPEEIRAIAYAGSVEYFNGDEWIEFVSPSPELYNHYAFASPEGDAMIVLQSDLVSTEVNRIGVYDLPTAREVGFFYTKDPDPHFLFIRNQHKVAYFEGNTPCLLNWETLEKECGVPLSDLYRDAYLTYVNHDESVMGFKYSSIHTANGSGQLLCLYAVFEGTVSCPMNDLEVFEPSSFILETQNGVETRIYAKSALETLISPDERFVYFTYDDIPPSFSQTRRAVVGVDGGTFRDLGLLSLDIFYSPSENNSQWRPLP